MKNFKNFRLLGIFLIASIFLISFVSCSDDNEGSSSGTLSIESVSKALNSSRNPAKPENNDSITGVGYPGNMYIIRGTGFKSVRQIYFNDLESSFNPTLVTDNVIFVNINQLTPYLNAKSELKLVGTNGTVIFPFEIGQPAPAITSFDPVAGGAGDVITIKGLVFDNLVAVRFGNIPAEIVSSTSTEIKVKTPDGIVQEFIFVETKGGIGKSTGEFGFKRIIFDESLAAGFQQWGGWGGATTNPSSEYAQRGTYSIKKENEGWGGLQFGGYFDGPDGNTNRPNLADYKFLKLSIYPKTAGKVKIVFNGDYGGGFESQVLDADKWNVILVPITATGLLTELVIQEFSGNTTPYYVDDLGFI